MVNGAVVAYRCAPAAEYSASTAGLFGSAIDAGGSEGVAVWLAGESLLPPPHEAISPAQTSRIAQRASVTRFMFASTNFPTAAVNVP